MSRLRIVIGAAGILLLLFGVFRLVTQIPFADLIVLAGWLIGALIIHDGVISPAVLAVGALTERLLPPRGRRYVQGGLVAAALVTVVATPLIALQGSQPRSKALLDQHFGVNVAVLLGIIASVTLTAYAVRVARSAHERK